MTTSVAMQGARSRVYRGWGVLAGAFAASMLSVGGTLYIFGLLVEPLTREFGLSRAAVNNGLIATILGVALFAPIVGQLIDRVSIRIIMPAGALLLAIGMAVIATSRTPWVMIVAAAGPTALGICCVGTLAGNAVVARWFHRRRGRALGLMSVSTSVGGILAPPLAAVLITQLGWRPAVLVLAGVVGVGSVLLGLFAIQNRPSEAELAAAGEIEPAMTDEVQTAAGPARQGITLKAILASRNFWLILICSGILQALDQMFVATNIPFFRGHGVSLAAASVLVALQSSAAIVGKIFAGFVAERVDVRRVFAAVAALHIVLLLFYIFWPGYWSMVLVIALVATAVGASLPVWSLLVAAAFDPRDFGKVSGTMSPGMQILSILFLRLSAESFDHTGSYTMSLWVFIAAAALTVVLIPLTRFGPRAAPTSVTPA
jgi:sugar phosphate permease